MTNRLIDNYLEITGNMDDVLEAVKFLRSNRGDVDFQNVINIDKEKYDIEMNDYLNAALNVYLNENPDIDRKAFINTMKFVGITREEPYEFTELEEKAINSFKSRRSVPKMMKEAETFVKLVKSGHIFSGFRNRNDAWGTGSQPLSAKSSGNRVSFITYGNGVENIVNDLSAKFPSVKVIYTYGYNVKDEKGKDKKVENRVIYSNAKRKSEKEDLKAVNTSELIKANVMI